MTRISTWAGDRGDAHSEYLGALSEQGIPGLVLLGGLFLMSMRIGMKIVYTASDRLYRGLAMAIVLALSTYYFHSFVNDFLDLDKAAVLFWGMMGMLAALDITQRSQDSHPTQEFQKSTP
jgi:putative inorganic carbon (hco3(-)) transporter